VDEYLSEKEQLERIREWWRENGWYLIAGVALGAVGIFGWNQYKAYVQARAEAAAALYLDLQDVLQDDDRTAAEALLAELREEHPKSPYTDQAGMLIAGYYVATEPSRAADELRFVMDRTEDRDLARIARLRLARVLIYQDRHEEALALLDVPNLGPFTAQYREAAGDAHYALGNTDAARAAYEEALRAPGAEWLNRSFVEMKLDALEVADDSAETGT